MVAQLAPFFKLQEFGTAMNGTQTVFHTLVAQAPNPPPWPRQKINNARAMLNIVKILTSPGNPNVQANQSVIFKSKLFLPILQMGLARDIPTLVRNASLYAVSRVVSGNKEIQEFIGQCVVQDGPVDSDPGRRLPVPVLYDLIRSAVDDDTKGKLEYTVRAASATVVQSFLLDNKDGQNLMASTFTPPPPSNPNDDTPASPQSAGNLLIVSLLDWDASRKDPYRSWFASLLLSHVLSDNPQCKQIALNLHVPDRDGMTHIFTGTDQFDLLL